MRGLIFLSSGASSIPSNNKPEKIHDRLPTCSSCRFNSNKKVPIYLRSYNVLLLNNVIIML